MYSLLPYVTRRSLFAYNLISYSITREGWVGRETIAHSCPSGSAPAAFGSDLTTAVLVLSGACSFDSAIHFLLPTCFQKHVRYFSFWGGTLCFETVSFVSEGSQPRRGLRSRGCACRLAPSGLLSLLRCAHTPSQTEHRHNDWRVRCPPVREASGRALGECSLLLLSFECVCAR